MDFVFVPGAWHGGWAWHPVARRLASAGHRAVALTMPGMSVGDDQRELRLADAVAHLFAEIERRDLTEVVLVGHSWGGIPIAGAARRLGARLHAIAMVSAFVPRSGESMIEALGAEVGGYLRTQIESSPNHSISLNFDAVRESLMQDEPEALQRLLYELLVPQPGGYMLDALDVVDFAELDVPMTYLLAEHDRALAAPGAELAARLGTEPVLVPGTHEAIITHADEVAKALQASVET
ncbi:alpha/beta fold hydrolase [Streptomyces parvulus]|uniref:alpha/beta fold hydrolase n=1 Tax=Streptomyces parvulus TaxID=146923 RepID=UPI00340CC5DC